MIELWNGLLSALGALLSIFYNVIPSYGVAIILLTVTVRLLLLPLTIKQTRSMQQMQQIQPKIKELQRKYKGDRQMLNKELMKLYQENQVNPMGGCLPLLLQLPVFFALYRVLTGEGGTQYLPAGALRTSIQEGTERFLGMNLACSPAQAGKTFEALSLECGSGIAAQIPFYIMIALMVGTMYYQQKQMQQMSTGPQAQQMKMMTTIMPIFLGVISFNIAAGVLVYWVTTNTWQILQQRVMLKRREESAAVASGKLKADGEVAKKEKPAEPPAKNAAAKNGQQRSRSNAGSRKKRRKR